VSSAAVSSGARLPQQLLEQRAAVGRGEIPRVALVDFHLQLAGRPARVADTHPEVTPLRDAGGHELLGAVQVRVRDALDDARRDHVGQGALERVQAVNLEVALDGVGAGEEPAVAHLPMPAPDPPAVQLQRRRPVEDDALCKALVVLKQEEDALVKKLLPQREAVLLLRAAEQDRALLDQRRLVHEASGGRLLACRLGNEPRSHLAPVGVVAFSHAYLCSVLGARLPRVARARTRRGDEQAERAGGEREHEQPRQERACGAAPEET
jgi:hypothetical protein